MTPKEKAADLVFKFGFQPTEDTQFDVVLNGVAKDHALTAIEEIINAIESMLWQTGVHNETDYWLEVKQEIEKL